MNFRSIESQLATLWDYWLFARKLLSFLKVTSVATLPWQIRQVRLFSNVSKFWKTMNPKFLEHALELMDEIRPRWIELNDQNISGSHYINGWLKNLDISDLRAAFPNLKIKRVFRPDVAYLLGKNFEWFLGIKIYCSRSQATEIVRSIGILFEVNVAIDRSALRHAGRDDARKSVFLEGISLDFAKNQATLSSAFEYSPEHLVWMIDATHDSKLAELLVDNFWSSSTALHGLNKEVLLIGKLALIATGAKIPFDLMNFTRLQVRPPNWTLTKVPDRIAKEDQPDFRIAPKYAVLKDVYLSNGGTIRQENFFVDWDASQSPHLDFVAGNLSSVVGAMSNIEECYVKINPKGAVIPSGIILSSRYDSNWFHFVIETLPRLLLIDDYVSRDVPVLVSNRIPKNGVELLKLVTSREVVFVDTEKETEIKVAYLAGPVIYHPDTQFSWATETRGKINFNALRALRQRVLDKIGETDTLIGTKRTFWSRPAATRAVLNEIGISKILTRHGFETVNPAGESFVEQVNSIRRASVLFVVGGALMANFIFADKDLRIFLLVSRLGADYKMPQYLSEISESKLTVISGRVIGAFLTSSYLQRLHLSFVVRPKKVRKILRGL